jgi:F0F1-type ATP synthase delta subunit
MFEEFINLTKTKDDVFLLEEEADILLNAIYEGHDQDLANFIKENVRANFAEIYTLLIERSTNKENDLKKLQETVAALESFRLTLAFSPSQGFIDRIYKMIAENAGHSFVLEFLIEPQILGGAEISFKGEYRDYTLKRFFEYEFAENKQKILKMLMYGEKIGS